ncbi:MAG: endonuclease NucS [Desulfurococcaceae archaeon]
MTMLVLENPDLDIVSEELKKAIAGRKLVILIGTCKVDYEGRGASRLEEGERVIIIKQDGAVLVHRPEGYQPVNWQPSLAITEVLNKPGMGLIIHVVRDKPREYLTILLSKVNLVVIDKLTDTGEFTMYLDEGTLRDIIVENPDILEKGLRIVGVEKRLGDGYVDIYGIDVNGRPVVIELKRSLATKEAVLQLYKYVKLFEKEHGVSPRGILVSPSFSPSALESLNRLGLEYKSIDLKELWGMVKEKRKKHISLERFFNKSD